MLLVLYWQLITSERLPGALAAAVLLLAGAVAVRAVKYTRDSLNSLTLFLGLCVLRVGVPTLLLIWGDVPNVPFLSDFSLTREELLTGAQLAAAGLLAVIVGWYASPQAFIRLATRAHDFAGRELIQDRRLLQSAVLVFALGFCALMWFLIVNFGNPLIGVLSGDARSSVAPGTSRYSFAAVALMVTSSLVLTLQLDRAGKVSRPVALLPVFVTSAALTVFGGRIVALTPLALALFGMRYSPRSGERRRQRRPTRFGTVVVVAVLAVLLVGYAEFVPRYRGGGGVSAGSTVFSASAARDNLEFFVWNDLGTLHSYALGNRMGPGSMDGESYRGFLGYAAPLLGQGQTEEVGSAFVDRFGVRSQDPWGFHTGLPVDVFVNSGFAISLLAGILLGAMLRGEYEGFRRSRASLGSVFLHCFALWSMIWCYFESVGNLTGPVFSALPTVLVIVLVARALPVMPPTRARFG